jgi:hypothetical protein
LKVSGSVRVVATPTRPRIGNDEFLVSEPDCTWASPSAPKKPRLTSPKNRVNGSHCQSLRSASVWFMRLATPESPSRTSSSSRSERAEMLRPGLPAHAELEHVVDPVGRRRVLEVARPHVAAQAIVSDEGPVALAG